MWFLAEIFKKKTITNISYPFKEARMTFLYLCEISRRSRMIYGLKINQHFSVADRNCDVIMKLLEHFSHHQI